MFASSLGSCVTCKQRTSILGPRFEVKSLPSFVKLVPPSSPKFVLRSSGRNEKKSGVVMAVEESSRGRRPPFSIGGLPGNGPCLIVPFTVHPYFYETSKDALNEELIIGSKGLYQPKPDEHYEVFPVEVAGDKSLARKEMKFIEKQYLNRRRSTSALAEHAWNTHSIYYKNLTNWKFFKTARINYLKYAHIIREIILESGVRSMKAMDIRAAIEDRCNVKMTIVASGEYLSFIYLALDEYGNPVDVEEDYWKCEPETELVVNPYLPESK